MDTTALSPLAASLPASLRTTDLQAGDVLLHMGAGPLSKVIAWVGDSLYSHAAVVYDGTQLMEAGATGVRFMPLAQRAQMVTSFDYIDVYRPVRMQHADRPSLLAPLQAALNVYVGCPYPMGSLAMLAITCAIRNKIPGTPELRLCLRMALDLAIANDSSQVVCSELVYRGFDEALTTPPHALRLPVIVRPPQDTPLPDIDVVALLKEYQEDCERARRTTQPKAIAASLGASLDADATDCDAGQLAQGLQQVRMQLGLPSGPLLAGMSIDHADRDMTDPQPNPKTVLPADLQFSPGLQWLGRLAMAAA